MPAITEAQVYDALEKCFDPELPVVNIVELGLIYDVDIDAQSNVHVKMTLTARGCPMHGAISADARQKILDFVPGVGDVTIEVVWEPAWTKDLIHPSAKKKLGIA